MRNMKILAILGLFAYVEARSIDEMCDGVIFNNIKHVKEVLYKGVDNPYQLATDYDNNLLFFSYTDYNNTKTSFKSGYITLETKEFHNIEGINEGFANSVDRQTNTVYLGARDGLYTFDFDTKKAKHVNGTSHNIWQIFVKEDVYYTTYPDEHVYVFKNVVPKRVSELENTRAMLFALSNGGNMYFSNSSGLFLYEKTKNYITFMGDYILNGITSDSSGNLFFSTPNGLYLIKDNDKKVETLVLIDDINGLAVEKDGSIVYSSQDSIIRLKLTKSTCIVN